MPQALPYIASAAATAAEATALEAAIIALAVSVGVSHYQTGQAESRARAAAAAAARNRNITLRSSVAPRRVVLGTARLSGPLMYAEFVGDTLEYLDAVVALTAGELSEVLGVYVGDEYIPAADLVANVPTTGKFSVTAADPYWLDEPFDLVASSSFTVAHSPVGILYVHASLQTGTEPDIVQTPLTVSSVVGDLVTLSAPATGRVNVRYASTYDVYLDPLKVQWAMGSASQATTTWAGVSTPKWTANHRLRGVSYVRTLKLIDHPLFTAGDSGDVGVVARGPQGVYDPRTATTLAYTSNPALLAAWWRTLATADGGLGVPSAWIDWDTVADAANVCDELISVKQLDGVGYENVKRYECHTVLSLDQPALDNLQTILAAMAGDFPFTGGKYRCYAGAFRSATVTLTDDDVAQESPITFAPLASNGESPPNIATARFYDAAHGWVETQARPVPNASYITADGQEEPLEIDLLASTDERQANYLMGVRLEQARPALACSLTATGKAADLALLDTLQLSLDGYSAVSAKTFEVRRRTNHWNGRYTLEMREVKASTYALDADRYTPATAIVVAPNDVLFAVDLPIIVSCGEQLVRQADGSLLSRAVLTWSPHTQAAVQERGQIQMRWAAAGAPWVYGPPVAGHEVKGYTGALNVSTLVTVQARAINGGGAPSGWAAAAPFVVLGKVDPPSNVAGLASSVAKGRVLWVWDTCPDADYSATEVRTSDANWGSTSVQPLFRGKASSWQEVVTAAATLTRYARHFDHSELYSATVASDAQVVADADLVQDGADAVASGVDRAAVVLAADSLGVVASGALPITATAWAKLGGTTDTTNWAWTRTSTSGITTTITGAAVTITAMTDSLDAGDVTITGARAGYDNIVIVVGVTKAKAAVPAQGIVTPGVYATSGLLVFSPATCVSGIKFKTTGAIASKDGGGVGTYSDVQEWYYGGTPGTYYLRMVQRTLSGGTLAGVGAGWQALTSDRTATLTVSTGAYGESLIDWQIATDAAGTDVRASGVIELSGERA